MDLEILCQINLSAPICIKLKRMFYPSETWQESYKLVAIKFSEIKKRAKAFYQDKEIEDILKELNRYSESDIKELFHVEL